MNERQPTTDTVIPSVVLTELEHLMLTASYITGQQQEVIRKAFHSAYKAHGDQKRASGEPYIMHPIAVAIILAELNLPANCIIAGLLHDTLEDTTLTKRQVATSFGEEVAELVDGVTKLRQINFSSETIEQAENLRKMIAATNRNMRVVLIKLADRLHNMRTIQHMPKEKQVKKAEETLEIFAPIARRLGMRKIFAELEDRSFATIYPLRHRTITRARNQVTGNNRALVEEIKDVFSSKLTDAGIGEHEITHRQKHIYSVYKKLQRKDVASFIDLADHIAFRIITKNVDACYRTLGVLHGIYKPDMSRFKDYIATPKLNAYQSLHTVLFGPYAAPIEVQIRTQEMHRLAESGVFQGVHDRNKYGSHQWIEGLMEMQKKTGSPYEFLENVKIELFPDEVIVHTAHVNRQSVQLPVGATALDLAYEIGDEFGSKAQAARIDRQLSPLSTVLSNNQKVEIITSDEVRPNPAWLDFVVTAKAKSSIRYYLKNQRLKEAVGLGEQMVERALLTHGVSLGEFTEQQKSTVATVLGYQSEDDCYKALGLGHVKQDALVNRFLALSQHQVTKRDVHLAAAADLAVRITGKEGSVIEYGHCCCPIPGDPIVGLLQIGVGIVVHRQLCSGLKSKDRGGEKLVPLTWDHDVKGEFHSVVSVTTLNERGVLARVATTCANLKVNIENIIVMDDLGAGAYARMLMTLSINSRQQLARVMRELRSVGAVVTVNRVKDIKEMRRIPRRQ